MGRGNSSAQYSSEQKINKELKNSFVLQKSWLFFLFMAFEVKL